MVVSVFLDPVNPKDSTRELLNLLRGGDYGPFYGRTPGKYKIVEDHRRGPKIYGL